MKQLREEGQRMDPAQQRAYECAEWHKRHQSGGNVLDTIIENSLPFEPKECETKSSDNKFDPNKDRQKAADDVIDQQLKGTR